MTGVRTNGFVLRGLLRSRDPEQICEWNPRKKRPAMHGDRFHGFARVLEAAV